MKYFVLLILTLASYFSFGQSTYTPPPPDTAKKHYTVVEQMPEFPGGDQALLEFVNSHIHYPKQSRKNHIEGKVIVQFMVHNSDGSLTDFAIIQSLNDECDAEALRVAKLIPNFIPGGKGSKDMKIRFVLPINFKRN